MKTIYFTVTNDLTYDQRMHRICGSLAAAGFKIILVGRHRKNSLPLSDAAYKQKRLHCFFNTGIGFYAEYNLRLFFFLLFRKMDAVCAIDLDTILPCWLASRLKNIKRIYDAHEYFTELKEVRTRPRVQKIWLRIEKFAVPRFRHGYTVSQGLVELFREKYGRSYQLVRNLPVSKPLPSVEVKERFLIYQGAVNEARGFEYLIPAMKQVPYRLVICGDGNFMPQLKTLIRENGVEEKIELRGMIVPEALRPMAQEASLGLGLAEKEGLNQFLALPNKFLEYMHAGLPQLAMAYPEYEKINSEFRIAVLLNELSVDLVAKTINEIMCDTQLLESLHENCLKAREFYSWQEEEKKLIAFYQELFSN